jgi:hypothetical protein
MNGFGGDVSPVMVGLLVLALVGGVAFWGGFVWCIIRAIRGDRPTKSEPLEARGFPVVPRPTRKN